MPQEIQQTPTAEGFMNVPEAWPLYDTILICPKFFGQEINTPGWFTSFADFGAKETHSFFNLRTEANSDLAYTNKQAIDSMDFAMEVYSFGLAFFAPSTRVLKASGQPPAQPPAAPLATSPPSQLNTQFAHFWEVDMPRHCAIDFKVQQDIVSELPAMAANPGYGPVGGGASFEHDQVYRGTGDPEPENPDYHPVMNMAVTQGVPFIKNRRPFPEPIQLPRTGVIEAVLTLSEYAKYYLKKFANISPYYMFGGRDQAGNNYDLFPARFGIQASLLGKRLVQRRAQYHR